MAIIIAYIESHKNKLIDELCADYVKKTQGSFAMKLLKLESSKVTIPEKQQELETQSLLSKLKPGDKLILCDETGNSYSSPAFSKFLSKQLSESRGNIFIAIGGAYGFSRSILEQYPKIKMSDFVFPHQIARLVLVEQVYRAYQIDKGTGYHH